MITDEEKREILDQYLISDNAGTLHLIEMVERAVLAKAAEQEPFAYGAEDGRVITKSAKSVKATADIFNIPLYAHPLPAQAIPEGWQLVPIEPTYEMLSERGCKSHAEGESCIHHDRRRKTWRSVLSASPKP